MTVLKEAQHGISVAVAFMSPHVRGLEGSKEERERLFEQRAREQEDELAKREARGDGPQGSSETGKSRL